ncbi:MAG: ribosome biogenesis factor YjgA [Xanthomonadales bacterium]|nr:ribosome biogenesis factor YjgA [Xanthomonadales bacterium]
MGSKQNLDADEIIISKSQRRRDALEVRSLAARLIALGEAGLGRMPLQDDLREAIDEARQIRSNVARKRQLQYVAKLLRRIDPEPILEAMDATLGEARHLTARQHRVEAWRDALLDRGDAALGELAVQRGDTDCQAIRQLLRNARLEAGKDRPPAAARALFRLLRGMDETDALPPAPPGISAD